MATYAIGDIQGCFTELMRLVERIDFNPRDDRLWLVGDLVNRGPGSLEVLRWVKRLGERAVVVLGNHDLHLIARALGVAAPSARDTLEPVLGASDCDELVAWLRQRPLLYREGRYFMVHAGLLPQWSIEEASALAREVEALLRAEAAPELLRRRPAGHEPRSWEPTAPPLERARTVLSVLTRLRTCNERGEMALAFAGAPDQAPPGQMPWFQVPGRRSADSVAVFGHWAALGLELAEGWLALDSGCVWGRQLTAVRLEDRAVFQVPSGGRGD